MARVSVSLGRTLLLVLVIANCALAVSSSLSHEVKGAALCCDMNMYQFDYNKRECICNQKNHYF
jgi:hypothetical protein